MAKQRCQNARVRTPPAGYLTPERLREILVTTPQQEAMRAGRLNAMWARFCREMESQGLAKTAELCADYYTLDDRRRLMERAIRTGRPAGWHFRNALEAADLGLSELFKPTAPAEPITAPLGTIERLKKLAGRVAAGQELFHATDRDADEG
jgi:hypothetical protein